VLQEDEKVMEERKRKEEMVQKSLEKEMLMDAKQI